MSVPSPPRLQADYSIAATPRAVNNGPTDDAAAASPPPLRQGFVLPGQAARFSRISNAGSVLPSRISRNAPPPVEM